MKVGPDGKILEESALSIIIYEVGSTELLEMQGTVEMDGKTELLKMDAITKLVTTNIRIKLVEVDVKRNWWRLMLAQN